MFSFGKIKLSDSSIFNGLEDFHSHVLPGVDDGVPKIEESLQILQLYESLGVRKLWLTPHIMEDIPNTTNALKEKFEELKAHYSGPIELRLAAEYMLDSLFISRLESKDLLPLGDEKQNLLVETSFWVGSNILYDMLQQTLSAGYFPVLAHPERFGYMTEADYDRLLTMGVKFQLNIPSLMGLYGMAAQKVADALLQKGAYSFIGSDLHSYNQAQKILSGEVKKKVLRRAVEVRG
ncbi:MAG: capsular biosynthesis protein [Bacteroidales bacterium]|nr:capsular biosynthesis protein [Bacteroidales bacterium]